MKAKSNTYTNVNEYVALFPKDVQKILKQMRAVIQKAAPQAVEGIAYGMPGYKVNGRPIAYFAAFKNHIGFYATPGGHAAFKKELAKYKQGKGSVQFPIDGLIPFSLIEKMVKFNVRKNEQGALQKKHDALHSDIQKYNKALAKEDRKICDVLAEEITRSLPEAENKIWHRSPVWFLDGNPVAGYAKLKECVQLLFWSGQSFKEKDLQKEGTFKAAEVRYTDASQINKKDLKRWLKKAQDIQWDYQNIVKRKGVLVKIVR